MMLFNKFIEKTQADVILVPNISLTDGIIRQIYEDITKLDNQDETLKDIVTNAKVFASKFKYNVCS